MFPCCFESLLLSLPYRDRPGHLRDTVTLLVLLHTVHYTLAPLSYQDFRDFYGKNNRLGLDYT